MLPLHRVLKSIAFISSLIFISCSSHKKESEIIKVLNEGMENSNRIIRAETMDVLTSLQSKMNEAGSEERTKVWFPKAEKVQKLSQDIFDHIENIKEKIDDSSINSEVLFDKLKIYREQVLQIDPKITNQFQKSLLVFNRLVDSSKMIKTSYFEKYFKSTSPKSVLAVLNRIENDIRINELRLITFCHDQIGRTDGDGFCTSFSVISILNSSVVMPGGNLEVISGIREFNRCYDPQIFVYKRPVPTDENGVAIYKLKAPSKPGKYYVPVKIKYTDQNGKLQTIQKEIEYTVANIQKE